ncbi:alpha/beta hydrolase [Alkalicaulis satelles]|uniref:Alpha/beta hydrolase n=1 Tax=Alkalicaulis satelles TaxID=2609175 RepID=A0A5M6ZC11_9PROT|nr:alpha/beta hydrolase [Alkalicaulis satelles]KAA5802249.1 alpha/beta hydrolase [Alkalicaulis satelles]
MSDTNVLDKWLDDSGVRELFSPQRTTKAMRDALERASTIIEIAPPPVELCEDITLPGAAGPMAARVYRPYDALDGAGLIYFHGGGFMVGSLDTHHALCQRLAAVSGVRVCAVDYRLAPEHPFPAAVDDADAALAAAFDGALEAYGFAPSRLSVGGDSAGGNLAAGLAQRLRGRIVFQLLIYPLLQLAAVKKPRPRWQEGPILSQLILEDIVKLYLAGADVSDLRASPLFENDLRGVAPAHILAAEFDPLMEEDRAYADRLSASGVPASFKLWNGAPHGFLNMSRIAPACIPAIEHAGRALGHAYK